MNPNPEQDEFEALEEQLGSLNHLHVTRDPVKANRTRAAFINEIRRTAVSSSGKSRLTLQNQTSHWFDFGKERLRMTPTIISILAALVLFFGGGSAGIVAAQNSLPDDLLFPVKLATEDLKAALTTDPVEKINLEMDLSQKRLDEITSLLLEGTIPDDAQFERLDNHLMTAFQLAMETRTQNSGEMTMLQNRLMEQARLMEQLQSNGNARGDAAVSRTRNMLMTQQNLVNDWITQTTPQGNGPNNQNSDASPIQSQDQAQDQTRDQTQDQAQDQTRDQAQDQTRDQAQDQTRDQAQDQTRDQTQDQSGSGFQYRLTPTAFPTMWMNQNNNAGSGGTSGTPIDNSTGNGTGGKGK